MSISTQPQKKFGDSKRDLLELTKSESFQKLSYENFLNNELSILFKNIFPFSDYQNSKFSIEFISQTFREPKYSVKESKRRMIDYTASILVALKFKNNVIGIDTVEEINFGEIPVITENNSFVINGVERTVVSQIVRSNGVFFNSKPLQGIDYFGAKIIPAKGRWVEIETTTGKRMTCRIDNKRKFPITTLMRLLGVKSDKEMLGLFNEGEQVYIKKMLLADDVQTMDDAYVSMYRHMRNSDPPGVEAAKDSIGSMFTDDYYDIGEVGRKRLNNRFNLNEKHKSINLSDIVRIVKEIIRLNETPGSVSDDIDHLGARRIRLVGELLKNDVRVGLARMKRNTQDKMSNADPQITVKATNLINPKLLEVVVREFFKTNSLSQMLKQTNILEEFEHTRTISATGKGGLKKDRAGFEVRDVHSSHYGRICPVHTPEGATIGLTLHLATYARINEFGLIETPYAKVSKGVISREIAFLTADEEERYSILDLGNSVDNTGKIIKGNVNVRFSGGVSRVDASEVDYIDISSSQIFSVSTALIPFVHNDLSARALYGSTMQSQAVPCMMPEAPLVCTGQERAIAEASGRMIMAESDGKVSEVDADHIKVKYLRKGERNYELNVFVSTNTKSISTQHRPVVSVGQVVKKGDLLADNISTDNGQIALGKNIRVAFMCQYGLNFEDAIIISSRLVHDDVFTSIHLQEFDVEVRNTKLGEEQTTPDIPNLGEARLRNLDQDGIVRIGSDVKAGDILVGKITPQTESQITGEERLLQSIFGEKAKDIKDTSLKLSVGKTGRVVDVQIFSRKDGYPLDPDVIKKIKITVAETRRIQKGDKLANRHGNKGVISSVLPIEDMPFTADGQPIDLILTPLGVPSRLNLGQILELHFGLVANTLGYQAVIPPMSKVTDKELADELVLAGFPKSAKVPLFDGKTGERYAQDVSVGYMYIMKLVHMIKDKIHMRAIGPYSLVSQQPLGGRARSGGQRFGEMEVWALLGHGAAHTLREMLTIKSDDVYGRSAAYSSIIRGKHISQINTPASFNVLLYCLRALGIHVEVDNIEVDNLDK